MTVSASSAVSKVSVTTASTAILPAKRGHRKRVLITVVSGGPIFISPTTATVNDFPVATNGVFEHQSSRPLYGIVATASADVRVWEDYDG
jgi:hypothetical protein